MSKFLKQLNWFGLATGIFMIGFGALAPAWWNVNLGGEAVTVEYSPFDISMTAFGVPMTSTLISFLCLGARVMITVAGGLMVLGSVLTQKWWSEKLVKFGSLKLLWMVVMLIIFAAVIPPVVEMFAGQVTTGADTRLNLPILAGSSTVTAQMDNVTLSAPITMTLTNAFFFAVIASALGVVARIYHRRLKPKKLMIRPKLLSLRPTEHKVMKVTPAEEKKIIARPVEAKKVGK